jgi:Na+-translocating ferredoxin:NAD+ oxidoreductase RNF subunit RnfB
MPAQSTPQPIAAATEPVTTVTYAVEEYLPFSERWVIGYNGIETAEEAIAKRDAITAKCAEAGDTHSQFRVTETTTVTTVRVLG